MPRLSKPNRHPSGMWRFTFNKVVHWSRTASEAWRKLERLQRDSGGTTETPVTVAGVIDRYLREHSEFAAKRLASFGEFAGSQRLATVTRTLLIEYMDWLAPRKLSPRTIRHNLACARSAMEYARQRDWLTVEMRKAKLPELVRKARDVAPANLLRILNKIPPRPRRLALFIAQTGCRPGEARLLRWDQIDLERRVAIVASHKTVHRTGRPRTIYLTPGALRALGEPGAGFVFLSTRDKPFGDRSLLYHLRKHGITPYALRHSFAQAASESIPVDVLAKLLGHTNTKTTAWYYEITSERAARYAETLHVLPDAESPARPADRKRGKRGESPPLPKVRQQQSRESSIDPARQGGKRATSPRQSSPALERGDNRTSQQIA